MKKFILTVMLAFIVSTAANADMVIKYNNAGAVSNPTPVRFGQNALFAPENQAIMRERQRQIRHEDQYYNGLEKGYATNINVNGSFNSGSSGTKVKNKKLKPEVKRKENCLNSRKN